MKNFLKLGSNGSSAHEYDELTLDSHADFIQFFFLNLSKITEFLRRCIYRFISL